MMDVVDSFGTNLRIEKLPDDMIKVHGSRKRILDTSLGDTVCRCDRGAFSQ